MNEQEATAPRTQDEQDAHFRLLCLIEQHPDYTQRRLAQAMGISLGKAHYLLRALFDRGLVKAARFGRSTSKAGYLYVITPAGIKHRLHMAKRFLQAKELEFEILKNEIERLRASLDDSLSEQTRPF